MNRTFLLGNIKGREVVLLLILSVFSVFYGFCKNEENIINEGL